MKTTYLLCVDGVPSRGVYNGRTYTQVDFFACPCGRPSHRLVSVAESEGRVRATFLSCHRLAPRGLNGWYLARRFVPLNDPGALPEERQQQDFQQVYILVDDKPVPVVPLTRKESA